MEPYVGHHSTTSRDLDRGDIKPHLIDQKTTPIDIESFISTLPQDRGWVESLPLYHYQGFWYIEYFLRGVVTLAQEESSSDLFEFYPSDIIICSCMKTGTTWLKALVFSIATRTRFSHGDIHTSGNILTNNDSRDSLNPLFKCSPHDLIPFLEIDIARDKKPRDPDLPIFSTHIPYSSLPRSIIARGCKIIYIWRDPKDTFISYWHFVNKIKSKCTEQKDPLLLEKAFDFFSRGISMNGPYWDHVLEYWKASQEFPDRVLFLKYEDMIEDTSLYVKKVADFMGYPFSKEEESHGVVEKIGRLCSFENLSQLEVNRTGKHRPNDEIPMENSTYFRKGKTGDWKNYLTPEMVRVFDTITREKFRNTGLVF